MASIINALSSGAGGLVTSGDTSGVLQLQNNSSASVTLDASGNVGIGTTSPTVKLDVNGTSAKLTNNASADVTVTIGPDTATASRSARLGFLASNTYKNWYIGSSWNTSGGLEFTQTTTTGGTTMASTPSMLIDSSGNLYVAATTNSYIVSKGATINASGSIQSAANSGNEVIGCYGNGVTTYISFYYNASTSGSASTGTKTGSITTNGTTTSYVTTSDYRLKENVIPMTGALDKIALLNPVTYTWKIDGANGQGFIAHELQEHFPEAVSGEKDAVDEEGKPKYQGIDTSFLVATLTAAIQELAKASSEQQTLIVSQSELINNLTARIEALEAK